MGSNYEDDDIAMAANEIELEQLRVRVRELEQTIEVGRVIGEALFEADTHPQEAYEVLARRVKELEEELKEEGLRWARCDIEKYDRLIALEGELGDKAIENARLREGLRDMEAVGKDLAYKAPECIHGTALAGYMWDKARSLLEKEEG